MEEDKGTLEERQWETMIDNGRRGEDLGKADTPSNTGTLCAETMGDKGRKELGKADTSQQRETRREMGDNRRQGGTRPPEGGRTIQHRHTCGQTKGDKGGQDPEKVQAHMWGDNGRQDLGKGDTPSQALGRRDKGRQGEHTCGETMGDKGTQGLGKANTPANTCWKTMGDKGRPSNTGTNVARHCETMGDKTLGRRTRQHRHMWGDGRQGETRREGGHTIHQRKTKGDTWGDKTSGRQTHHPTQAHMWGGNGRQDSREGDTPCKKGKQAGKQWETRGARPPEGGHTIEQSETRRGTMETRTVTMGDKTHGKADTPSNKENKNGYNGRQDPREGGHAIQQREQERVQWETRPSGRRTHHPTSSNKGKREGRQGETRLSGRRTHHATKKQGVQ